MRTAAYSVVVAAGLLAMPLASASTDGRNEAAPTAVGADRSNVSEPSRLELFLRRVQASEAPGPADDTADPPTSMLWQPFSSEAYLALEKSGRPFLVEFTADWCLPCQEMKDTTFQDPRVVEASRDFGLLRVDITEPDRGTELAQQAFKAPGAPTLIFLVPGGKERFRRLGYVHADAFLDALSELKKPAPEEAPEESQAPGPAATLL